jgi:hypothetical protein
MGPLGDQQINEVLALVDLRPYLGDLMSPVVGSNTVGKMIELRRDAEAHLENAVEAHRAGDGIARSYLRFLTGIEWQDRWLTPKAYREALDRATIRESYTRTWVKTSWGGSRPGPGHVEEHWEMITGDREIIEQYRKERRERIALMDTVHRADVRRWERAIDRLDRDSPEYKLALELKPVAPAGYHSRIEAKKRMKNRDAEVAAIVRRRSSQA